jgi:carbon-monoxide dehydrogenase medium subunit
MKPAPFIYHDPHSIDDALDLLARHENTRVLAGGQSLMPMMNFRYAMPDHLLDLNKVDALSYIRINAGQVAMGAMTRQRDIEFSPLIATHCPLLQEALTHVGHRQTRNRGTIGGSLCHLDPSAELANIAALYDATIEIHSQRGVRELPFAQFALAYMTTALEPDELMAGMHWPLLNNVNADTRQGAAFVEFARRHGDFSIVACSAMLHLNASGEICAARIALSGLGHAPIRPGAIEQQLIGMHPDAATLNAAASAAQQLESTTDAYVSATYRQHLARTLTLRALTTAASRALETCHV